MNRFVLSVLATACLATGAQAQQGPPNGLNVNVLNAPGVNVLNTPLAVTGSVTTSGSVSLTPGSSVSVNSSVQNPVRVRDVNDANQPVQAKLSCGPLAALGCGPGSLYTVPLGKRLVIEFVSMRVCGLPGLSAEFGIITTTGGTDATYALTTAPSASPGSQAIGCNSAVPSSTTSVSQSVRLYADAGTTVFVSGDRANGVGGIVTFSFSMSGYLVDVPLVP
jgi:hypothetical protein